MRDHRHARSNESASPHAEAKQRKAFTCTRSAAVLLAASALALAGTPALASHAYLFDGPEFQANEYTTGSQSNVAARAVARNADGAFVVVWEDAVDQLSYERSIRGRVFDKTGVAVTGDLQISASPTEWSRFPQPAMAADDSFVVVWQKGDPFQDLDLEIYGRRFDAAGAALGTEFVVNSYNTGSQGAPAIAAAGAGTFVAVWESFVGGPTNNVEIKGRRLDAAGTPLGADFQVNSNTSSGATAPDISAATDGSFLVAYETFVSSVAVKARRFTNANVPVAAEFQLSTGTTATGKPTIELTPDGGFIAGWSRFPDPDGTYSGVYARRFSNADAPLGAEFQVNSFSADGQSEAAVAVAPDGGFTFVWNSYPDPFLGGVAQDGSHHSVHGQRFDGAGVPLGAEFQINTYTRGSQLRPSIASDGNGDVVVTWDSHSG